MRTNWKSCNKSFNTPKQFMTTREMSLNAIIIHFCPRAMMIATWVSFRLINTRINFELLDLWNEQVQQVINFMRNIFYLKNDLLRQIEMLKSREGKRVNWAEIYLLANWCAAKVIFICFWELQVRWTFGWELQSSLQKI